MTRSAAAGATLSRGHHVLRRRHVQEKMPAGRRAPAVEELLPAVYGQLRGLAGGFMRQEGGRHTLQATALVHEAYMKLQRGAAVDWQGRVHFFRTAGRAMRQVLIDHARRSNRRKRREPANRLAVDFAESGDESMEVDLLALDAAMTKLSLLDARQAKVVELRFLAGLKIDEVARVMDVSRRTVELDWRSARAWLLRELHQSGELT